MPPVPTAPEPNPWGPPPSQWGPPTGPPLPPPAAPPPAAPNPYAPPAAPNPYAPPAAPNPYAPPGLYVPPPPGPWGQPAMYAPVYPHTSGLAVASLVLGIIGWVPCGIGSVVAIVLGFVARTQIRSSNGSESGDGMARAGIILGFAGIGLWITYFVVYAIVSSHNGTSS